MVHITPHKGEYNRPEPDDNELVRRVAACDRVAFGMLMRRHMAAMVMTAQRLMSSRTEADDVVQEAFLRLWMHAGRWNEHGTAQFKTWLRRIVTNLCMDRLRRRAWLPWEAAGDPEDENADSFASTADKKSAEIIRRCIAELPLKQKCAVQLYYVEGLVGHDVAETMSISIGALESLLLRARRRMKRQLEKQGVETWRDL